MDAIAEANAESDAQREAHMADLTARLGDAIDRIGMLEVRGSCTRMSEGKTAIEQPR